MHLRSIFEKPIDRPIEGVIKADDDTTLKLEVDEYVLTNEVQQRLEDFLDSYNNYHGANGAWISGFFGCGKSHLLKMLALLLSNQEIDGQNVAESFLKKCEDNSLLSGAIKKAVAIPARSILFNIDQKSDVISKSQVDALLSVFMKVFDDSCGYFGKQGYIAQFERLLDEDELLTKFTDAFTALEPRGWEWGRVRVTRVSSIIDQAYKEATGQEIQGVMDRYKADYKVSIEDFANHVNRYIKKQPEKNFRLNFFIDEVGQYIADNTKLMTNLQTIAESLATKCKGQAFIIVTAQGDINTVIGEMSKEQGNDFSKIQARFEIRMKLTGQNVAEVIQKRLLKKTPDGESVLDPIYEREQNNFKTLFDFTDGGQRYKNFRNKNHFIESYPFVPYQFDLFQSAIRNLSEHNAFEGRYKSFGERSMLGVFQEVAVNIANHEVGELATFDLMYEGIRTTLKSNVNHSISSAERNLDNKLAVKLLKSLFLLKYVKEFKPTVRNLTVLMLDHFDSNVSELKRDIESALKMLETQIYIQRNGELYEFLTNEEKDVEQEIKNMEVDIQDIYEELSKIVFDQVIKTRKLHFEETKQDYTFTRKLDERVQGREYELAVHVISPFHEDHKRIENVKMRVIGLPELLLVLPPDDELFRDITLYKQTSKYINQNISLTQQESIKRILTDKTFRNKERLANIVQKTKDAIGDAKMFVDNKEIESNSHDPITRIQHGFEKLVRHTYTNLPMLRGIPYSENYIEQCLRGEDDGLFAGDATTMSEAETEMLSYISRKTQGGISTTIKQLVEDFEKKPFGWYLAAILCTLAKLCGRGKVEARSDSELLEDDRLVTALKNTRMHGNVFLEPQIDFTASQIRHLKEFYEDFFDKPLRSSEAKSIGKEVAKGFQDLYGELNQLYSKSESFPFLSELAEPLQDIQRLGSKSFKYFLTDFEPESEKLLDLKENLLDPVRQSMSGKHAQIYADARTFYQDNKLNFPYIDGTEANQLKTLLEDKKCFTQNGIKEIKSLHELLNSKIEKELNDHRKSANEAFEDKFAKVQSLEGYEKLDETQKREIQSEFDRITQDVMSQNSIVLVKDISNRFNDDLYPTLLSKVSTWTQPKDDEGKTTKPIEYISLKSIEVNTDFQWLTSEDDVEKYAAELKKAMMQEIDKGKRIQI